MKSAVAGDRNIEGLQLLRAVAALMVVVHHARHSVPGTEGWPTFGEVGVDIFFVISGFVMAHTTRALALAGGTGQRLRAGEDFLRRRIVRIVPLYWLATLWTSRREIAHGAVDGNLLKDFFFLPHPNATYEGTLAPTLIQGWTLNYEMFFYLLFAASLLFGGRRTLALMGALLIFATIGFALSLAGIMPMGADWNSVATRFYTHNILLEFGYGVLLQRLIAAGYAPDWRRIAFGVCAALGFLLIALGHEHAPRAFMQGLPAVLIVWAVLYASVGRHFPVLGKLGDASYAIYLFHWASFGAAKPVMAWIGSDPSNQWQVALLMAIHVLIATLAGLAIHQWIEKPMMDWAKRRILPRRAPLVDAAAA